MYKILNKDSEYAQENSYPTDWWVHDLFPDNTEIPSWVSRHNQYIQEEFFTREELVEEMAKLINKLQKPDFENHHDALEAIRVYTAIAQDMNDTDIAAIKYS